MKNDDGLTATRRYAKKYLVPVSIYLNRNTDADILERLERENNRQGFIKALIRERIARENNETN